MTESGQPPHTLNQPELRSPGITSGEPRDAAGFLLRALNSKNTSQKRSFALQGIRALERAPEDEDDSEMQVLLLRQIYLADIEDGHDAEALEVALEMIDLGDLGDIARQDAARAALGKRDLDAAIEHLRVATRICPPERRAFHYGHLGALLRFDGQTDNAVEAFQQALRWATKNRNLYQAQQALVQPAVPRAQQSPPQSKDFSALRTLLENEEPRHGYCLWILGELCLRSGDENAGKNYLRQFLSHQEGASRAKSIALREEIAHATALLKQISA